MSGQVENLLRCLVNGDKEAVITAVSVALTPSLFSSQLVNGFPRKAIFAYNQSPNLSANSGECYYGYASNMSPTVGSHPIPNQSSVEIPVTTNIPIYFCCRSGEIGNLRIEEIA